MRKALLPEIKYDTDPDETCIRDDRNETSARNARGSSLMIGSCRDGASGTRAAITGLDERVSLRRGKSVSLSTAAGRLSAALAMQKCRSVINIKMRDVIRDRLVSFKRTPRGFRDITERSVNFFFRSESNNSTGDRYELKKDSVF